MCDTSPTPPQPPLDEERPRRKRRRLEDEKPTEELLEELLSSERPTDFLDSHELEDRDLGEYLTDLCEQRGLKRSRVLSDAGIDYTYGYQLFTGKRTNPSRDKVLQLAFAMSLSIRECDRLLQAAGKSRLYCKSSRDAIIMFCLDRKASMDEANAELFARGEQTLN